MVSHLCHIAAERAERGALAVALDVIEQARVLALPHSIDPEGDYREGLISAGVRFDDIDEAFAAIARGEHPAVSLPGKGAEYRRRATREAESRNDCRTDFCEGEVHALDRVLNLLGVTPAKVTK